MTTAIKNDTGLWLAATYAVERREYTGNSHYVYEPLGGSNVREYNIVVTDTPCHIIAFVGWATESQSGSLDNGVNAVAATEDGRLVVRPASAFKLVQS